VISSDGKGVIEYWSAVSCFCVLGLFLLSCFEHGSHRSRASWSTGQQRERLIGLLYHASLLRPLAQGGHGQGSVWALLCPEGALLHCPNCVAGAATESHSKLAMCVLQATYRQPEEVQFSFKLDTGAPGPCRSCGVVLGGHNVALQVAGTGSACDADWCVKPAFPADLYALAKAKTTSGTFFSFNILLLSDSSAADLYALAKAKTTAHSIDVSRDGSKFVTFSADGCAPLCFLMCVFVADSTQLVWRHTPANSNAATRACRLLHTRYTWPAHCLPVHDMHVTV